MSIITTPLTISNLTAEYAGLTLFAVTGRYHGDDDDSLGHFWAATAHEANMAMQREILEEEGVDIESLSAVEYERQRGYVYILETQAVATVADMGTHLAIEFIGI